MISVQFMIKSGTCGWHDYDDCSLCLKRIKREDNQFVIPPIGSKVVINTKDKMCDTYIVNDIKISYGDSRDDAFDNTYIDIYVLEYNVRHRASDTLKEIQEKREASWKKKK